MSGGGGALVRTMDRLETVEKLMSIEEAFGAEIPDDLTQHSGGTREMVDWLELRLSNQRPNKRAQVFLKKLAKTNSGLNRLRA
jgi:hypothetical protein